MIYWGGGTWVWWILLRVGSILHLWTPTTNIFIVILLLSFCYLFIVGNYFRQMNPLCPAQLGRALHNLVFCDLHWKCTVYFLGKTCSYIHQICQYLGFSYYFLISNSSFSLFSPPLIYVFVELLIYFSPDSAGYRICILPFLMVSNMYKI